MTTESIEHRLCEIPHSHLDLTDDDKPADEQHCNRPRLSVWAGFDDDGVGAHVVLGLSTLWGQASRFVELMPFEARALAKLLSATADAIDSEVGP